jgi:hypothetical protein
MQITIIARRWFQKSYGNTYHSCVVLVDGQEIGRVDFTYGYGDAYLQTAHSLLQEAGLYPKTGESLASGADKDYNEFLMDTRENRGKFVVSVSDVARKKDL